MNLKKKFATETQRHRDRGREGRRYGALIGRSVSPWLCGKFIGLAAAIVMALSIANGCVEAPGKSSDVYMASRPATLAAGEPEPPRVYLDTTYTPPKGRSIEVKAGGDFQAALNQARPGDAITLEAGATFTGNFTLPNKSGSGQSEWIVVRSSAADSGVPPPGTRITPSYSNVLPKIVSPNS